MMSEADTNLASGYAIANNNPTWTERKDEVAGTTPVSMAFATATASAASDTGNGTITTTSSVSGFGFIIAVQEDTNVTATHSQLASTPTFFSGTGSASVICTHSQLAVSPTMNAPTASATTPTQWVNESSPTTTWVNEQK